MHDAQSGIVTPCDFSFARAGVAAGCTPNIDTPIAQDVDLDQLRRHPIAALGRPVQADDGCAMDPAADASTRDRCHQANPPATTVRPPWIS